VYIYRLSSAGTGGTAVAISGYDSADTYAGAAAYTPTSKGTEGALLFATWVAYPAANGIVYPWVWTALPGMKPIIFGPATSSGIVFVNVAKLSLTNRTSQVIERARSGECETARLKATLDAKDAAVRASALLNTCPADSNGGSTGAPAPAAAPPGTPPAAAPPAAAPPIINNSTG
jgi:hypothetical protein